MKILQGVYYLKDVELNVEKLPPIFPEKNGTYEAVILDKQESLFRIKVVFQILKTFKNLNWNKSFQFLIWSQ